MEILTELAPSSGEAVRAELSRIMNDPGHSMHEGFKRNETQVNAYIDGLYKKAYGSAPAVFDQGITITTPSPIASPQRQDPLPPAGEPELTPQERMYAAEFDMTLQRVFGAEYSAEMTAMRLGSARLFGTPEALKALDALAPVLTEIGVHAQVAAVRFLSQIGRLPATS